MDSFLKNNIEYIIAFVILFISLLTMFTVLGVDFNPHRHEHIEKIVTIESFEGQSSDNDDLLERSPVQPLGSLEENPGLYQVKDGAEETGRSVSASASRRDQKIIAERRNRERRIKTLLVNANSNFVQTLADSKGLSSQCHARFGDQISTEKHCNNIKRAKGCATNNCCVWLFNESAPKCVSGSSSGPVYLTRDGKSIDDQKYFHKGKCYGLDC